MSHKKAPPVVNDDPTMRGQRSRTEDGTLREKRGDTLVRTIEELHHVDFDVRGDMRLDTLKARLGVETLSEALKKAKKV